MKPRTEPIAALDRDSAYTTVRSDVAGLVPDSAAFILDVGCSNGALGASLKRQVPGRHVTGVEFDKDFAAAAAQRLDHVICVDVNAFDWLHGFGGAKFDCIIFADVLEHLVDPPRHLLGAVKSLNQGGCIVMSLPNVRHLSAWLSIYVKGHFPRRSRGLFDATHLRWFTIADGRQLLSDIGCEIDADVYVLRAGDQGGGRLNRLLNKLPTSVKQCAPVREFLTYQFSLRASPRQIAPANPIAADS